MKARFLCARGGWVLFLFALLGCMTVALAGKPIQTVSGPSPTPPPNSAGGDSLLPVISKDGRYVLFASSANNLVVTSNNVPYLPAYPGVQNVYLRDRTNGTTTLVSVNLSGTGGGNADCFPVDISTNGQYALFESTASNFVTTNFFEAFDTRFHNQLFMRDVVNGTTALVTMNTGGTRSYGDSRGAVMTPDGRYVAFASDAYDLVTNSVEYLFNIQNIFVRDMQSATTVLASPGAMGTAPTAASDFPCITPDGHYVAFYSTATNLVSGVTNISEIYIRDLVAGVTTRASAYSHTVLPTVFNITNGVSFNQVMTPDGQYLVYQTGKTTTNGAAGIVLRYNTISGFTDIINTNAAAGLLCSETNYHSLDMSADGRFVSFVGNLNTNGATSAVYVWDALSNSATLVSGTLASNTVPTNTVCDWPVMDASGQFVAFLSSASGLTSNSVNPGYHLYRRDLQAGVTQLVDVDTNGVGSTLNAVTFPRMSTNGQFVAFEAPDGSLVAGDNNNAYDVFLRDLVNEDTELVSSRRTELPSVTPNGHFNLYLSSVSGNARYIAFSSDTTNFVSGISNGFRNIYVRDLLTGAITLASVSSNGVAPGNGHSDTPVITPDGRYVAFTSSSSNMLASDTNKFLDVFVRDLQLSNTTLVSINTNGTSSGNNDSYAPLISTNGRYVLFRSKGGNLAPGVTTTGDENVYWRDLQTGTHRVLTTNLSAFSVLAAITPDGRYVLSSLNSGHLNLWDMQLDKVIYTNSIIFSNSPPSNVAISPDGTRIVFVMQHVEAVDRTISSNFFQVGSFPCIVSNTHAGLRFSGDSRFLVYTAWDSNYTNQIYLYDFQLKTNVLISSNYTVTGGGMGNSDSPDISSDGRFIAYRSVATNLVASYGSIAPQIYLYDRTNGTTTLITTSVYGNSASAGRSLTPVFSADGQTLVFQSWSDDVTTQDFNQSSDIFALYLYSASSPPAFSAEIVYVPQSSSPPTITWQVTPWQTYQVQYKNNLTDPAWQTLNATISFNGNQASITDPSAPTTHRFYRIVAQ